MTFLNDFFIANDTDQLISGGLENPTEDFSPILPPTIDLVMLCTLESILTGNDWELIFDRDYVSPAQEYGPEGPWVYVVSKTLIGALAQLPINALHHCACQWLETDDWTVQESASLEKVISCLEELIQLAKQADQESKKLFLKTSI